MKKLLVVVLTVSICLSAAGCGDEAVKPDQLQTPQYSIVDALELPEPDESEIHTSQDGIKVIPPSGMDQEAQEADTSASSLFIPDNVTPETVWENDTVVTYNAFTLPEKAAFDNGSLGVLSIPAIGLSVNVYESGDQMEDMERGVAHFKSTSAWDGNVALSGHNQTVSGHGAFFKDLHKLAIGDRVRYMTALGEREYTVATVKTISESDWSALGRTTDNRLTMITCVQNNPSKRLLIQAMQD